MDQDKIDLSSVNKTKKQFSLPRLKNPFKKQAGPARDQEGKFTTGSGGLINTKHFNWKRAAPLMVVVALVGGFFVYRSFAGTYRDCANKSNNYTYTEACVTESDEAAVVRLYYGIFNRAPDQSGLNYWTNRLATKKVTLTEMARQFMGSSEFKSRYGSLSNMAFVNAMYPQVFGRAPDAGGLNYWVGRLNNKTITREAMMTNFTQSSEMKRNFALKVAGVLNIPASSYLKDIKRLTANDITCFGTKIRKSDGKDWCSINIQAAAATPRSDGSITYGPPLGVASISAKSMINPGAYTICGASAASGHLTPNYSKGIYLSGDMLPVRNDIRSGQASALDVDRYGGPGHITPWQAEKTSTFCHAISLAKANADSILISIQTAGQPAGSKYEFDMSSVQIGSNLQTTTFPETFGKSRAISVRPCERDNCKYRVGNTTYPLASDFAESYKVSPSTEKPHWIHTSNRSVSGKNRLSVSGWPGGYSSDMSRNLKVKVSLKDKSTGKPIKFTGYQYIPLQSGKVARYTNSEGRFTIHNYNSLEIEFESANQVTPVFELEVIEGSYAVSQSRQDVGWHSEVFSSNRTYVDFND